MRTSSKLNNDQVNYLKLFYKQTAKYHKQVNLNHKKKLEIKHNFHFTDAYNKLIINVELKRFRNHSFLNALSKQ